MSRARLPAIRSDVRRFLLCLALCVCAVWAAPAAHAEGALAFDKQAHDFGTVGQGQELEAVFRFTNQGTGTISQISARPDCGCYGLSLSDTVLGPGESGTLRVRFRTLTFFGLLTKHARLSYNDGALQKVKLALTMRIEAGILLQPARIWFGEVVVGRSPQKSVHLIYRVGRGRAFRVTKVTAPEGEFGPIQPIPYTDPRDPKWKGWALNFRFLKPPPKGVYSKRAVVETDHPDFPRIEISLTANVVGKVWVQKPRIHVGLIAAGQQRQVTTNLRPALRAGVKLGRVQVKSRKGFWDVTLAPVPGRPEHYILTVALKSGAKPGLVDDVIEIHTEVPGEPITTIEVRGRVFQPRGASGR